MKLGASVRVPSVSRTAPYSTLHMFSNAIKNYLMKMRFANVEVGFLVLVTMLICSISSVSAQEMPNFTTPEEKSEWISKNPDLYQKMIEKGKQVNMNEHKQSLIQGAVSTSLISNAEIKRTKVEEDGFPSYIDTGDEVKDEDNYLKAKKEWIERNPKKYEKLIRNN